MKNKGLFFIVLSLFFGTMMPVQAQLGEEKDDLKQITNQQVEVYYFHYSRRCATCMAVESESEKALQELYPEKVESGEINFLSVDLEEEKNEAMAEEFKISGQTLLIVKGDQQENLTNTAFMYAKSDPEKLKKAIRKTIDKME